MEFFFLHLYAQLTGRNLFRFSHYFVMKYNIAEILIFADDISREYCRGQLQSREKGGLWGVVGGLDARRAATQSVSDGDDADDVVRLLASINLPSSWDRLRMISFRLFAIVVAVVAAVYFLRGSARQSARAWAAEEPARSLKRT